MRIFSFVLLITLNNVWKIILHNSSKSKTLQYLFSSTVLRKIQIKRKYENCSSAKFS